MVRVLRGGGFYPPLVKPPPPTPPPLVGGNRRQTPLWLFYDLPNAWGGSPQTYEA